ncbi:MAG: PAS domain S-box protein [Deltaproteobacteria bacterium]|nr:PAS domain S-box protein [Deltaproteobacteria bacterium]
MKPSEKPMGSWYRSFVFKLVLIHSLALMTVIVIWVHFTMSNMNEWIFVLTVLLILSISAVTIFISARLVTKSLKTITDSIQSIAQEAESSKPSIHPHGKVGELAMAIDQMKEAIARKQEELQRQRDEYQILFDQVPCLITVQDRNFNLLNFNQEFADQFEPRPGDYCYKAYKGRDEKCVNCLVEKTFEDGKVHSGEETGLNKDGKMAHWILRTSPIRNTAGEIVATMEMSVDITEKRQLEKDLETSEKKYQGIFDNIPNPVFVLDSENLAILDCNASVEAVYGYAREETLNRSFLDFFLKEERDQYAENIKSVSAINQVRHRKESGETIFVNIRVSPADYPGKQVLLVTTSDITKWLETEQQLIQAGKMGTLGEMASAMAHEINQPLSVIKTACGFFMMKKDDKELIEEETLFEVIEKMDKNVDRATRIINNMREFARKSGMDISKISINNVIKKAFEFFTQQLKLREIETVWNLEEDIPKIMADPGQLEQVFINLFLNARDAIEQRWGSQRPLPGEKRIAVKTESNGEKIICEICDTGIGIPETHRDRVFEPFFTTKEVGKGMGLGLSISYGIVKEYGGTIRVLPNDPEGACFILEFPIA